MFRLGDREPASFLFVLAKEVTPFSDATRYNHPPTSRACIFSFFKLTTVQHFPFFPLSLVHESFHQKRPPIQPSLIATPMQSSILSEIPFLFPFFPF